MNRLLAFFLCCTVLLPAAALAQEGGDEGGWRPTRVPPRHHADRAQLEHPRMDRGQPGKRHFSRTDFFVRGGYAVGTGDNRLDGGSLGRSGNGGGVALEAGFRYWLTRELGIGLAAGYTDLGRNRQDGGIAVPLTSNGTPPVVAPGYLGRNSRLSAFPVTAQITYRAPIHGVVRPYVELGGGAYILRGPGRDDRVYAMGTPVATGSPDTLPVGGVYDMRPGGGSSQSVHLGFLGGAGLEFRTCRHLSVTLGARWNLITAYHDSYDHATFLAGLVLR